MCFCTRLLGFGLASDVPSLILCGHRMKPEAWERGHFETIAVLGQYTCMCYIPAVRPEPFLCMVF